tara:strand:+ start:56 stop:226 length:171 start_codon:yes stop_codon:yes gene_type:complete
MNKYVSSFISSNLGISSSEAERVVLLDLQYFINFEKIDPSDLLEIAKIFINKRNKK